MISSLPQYWTAPKLSEVCQINPRERVGLAEDDLVSFVPMSAVSELSASIVAAEPRPLRDVQRGFTQFREGDVLFARITPSMENGKAAIARNLINQCGYGSTEFHVIRPSALVLPEWILAIIRLAEFRRAAAGSFQGAGGQQRVPASFLESFRIPLPPLSEQRRIGGILQEADAIRRLSAEAESKIGELIPAMFHRLFLEAGNRSSWVTKTIKEIAAPSSNSIRTGPFGSDLLHSEFVDSGIPVLGIDNAVSNRFQWVERRYITPEKYSELLRYRVYPGDVMVTIMGTVGRVAVAPNDLPEAISTKHLCVITLDLGKILPWFLWATLLFDPSVRAQTRVSGQGGVMEGWNLKIIRAIKLRVPPLDLQRQFQAQVLEALNLSRGLFTTSLHTALSASLTAYAFSGRLTARWRAENTDALAREVRQRDIALQESEVTIPRTRSVTKDEIERVDELYFDGVYSDLTREQRNLWGEIQRRFGQSRNVQYFTARSVSDALESPLQRNLQGVAGHLAVFAARGLVIPVSREEQTEDTGEFVFGNAYRLPLTERDYVSGEQQEPIASDHVRLREMERLLAEVEREGALA